ncbi:hypothetical protein K492DRAFT_174074 [Lichtheimia hyalospora FSU 10163]|nr:hypothetical protein K492DRAFT_174074 [Lichtheimia hyalospora FSU 10163]
MSTLEEIDVFNISPATSSTYLNSVVPSWLFLIPHLARIKRFTLVPGFDMDASFVRFMDTLAQNSLELEEISLELASYSIAQGVLSPLQQLKNLKSIVIQCDKLCEHDILELQSCPALNHLCIHTQINQLSPSTQDALSASIKRVTII